MPSIFTRILQGEIPAYVIAEEANYIAILDAFPVTRGHVLVIPKEEIPYIFDMEDDALSGLMVFAKKIAGAVEKAVPCQRVCVSVIGVEVPHTHVHLLPFNSMEDLDFTKKKLQLPEAEMLELQAAIQAQLV
jgi:histidine triad (HIT) family protein